MHRQMAEAHTTAESHPPRAQREQRPGSDFRARAGVAGAPKGRQGPRLHSSPEASGVHIVPKEQLPASPRQGSARETGAVRGKRQLQPDSDRGRQTRGTGTTGATRNGQGARPECIIEGIPLVHYLRPTVVLDMIEHRARVYFRGLDSPQVGPAE